MTGETLNDQKAVEFKNLLNLDGLSSEELKNLVENQTIDFEGTNTDEVKDAEEIKKNSTEDLFAEFDIVDEPKHVSKIKIFNKIIISLISDKIKITIIQLSWLYYN